MTRTTRKPNTQLRNIVLEETDNGRDVVRYLKSVFMEVDDAPRLFGLAPDEYARTHKIAAARILARLGLEEGKRYLRRNYVQTPFKRVHPEDEDGPKRDMASATADLYRLVRKETNDGRDIMIYFVGIMKGCHNGYKPHLRLAAAKELVRQIEFEYDDQPTAPAAPSRPEPTQTQPVSADAAPVDTPTHNEPETAIHAEPTHELAVADSEITAHPQNHTNHSSEKVTPEQENHDSDAALQAHHEYAGRNCAEEAESIYRSIIRRASDQPDLDSAKLDAERLIDEFNQFAADRDPDFQPVTVPDDLLSKSLTQRMEEPESYLFDPAEYYDFDQDDFYFCRCGSCEECDELEFFFEFLRELEEETDYLYEDP